MEKKKLRGAGKWMDYLSEISRAIYASYKASPEVEERLKDIIKKIAQQAREEADYYVRVVTLEEVAKLFDSSTLHTEWRNDEISEFIRSLKTKGQD